MKAILERPIILDGMHFRPGVYNEGNPHMLKLFAKKNWFLDALSKAGHLILHHEIAKEESKPVDSVATEAAAPTETIEAPRLREPELKSPKSVKEKR